MAVPRVSLALQGGSTHGAFTWGVLDRLLDAMEAGRFELAAISGASAGAMNATVMAVGLMEGGPAAARQRLEAFWWSLSQRGAAAGNAWFGFAEPGPGGWNIDWNPAAIALEAAGLVVSPYTNLFYTDALTPLLTASFPGDTLARLNQAAGPRLFLSATNVANNARTIFTQPDIGIDMLRASSCLPTEFKAVTIDGTPYWDGGYTGNPALSPLVDQADDLVLVMVNPLSPQRMPPRSARAILDRLNQITFNASVVLEVEAIETVNRLLRELQDAKLDYRGRYRPINLHLIRDDKFMETLGFVSKNSTSWALLLALRHAGHRAAERWLAEAGDQLGVASSVDVRGALTGKVLPRHGSGG